LQVAEYLNVCEIEVFVSSSSYEEIYFNRKEDTQMTGVVPSATLTVSDVNYCLQECLSRRSSYYYCTAFNWVTLTRSCQLFSVNTYILQTENLIGAPGTHFYSQNNLLL
ncbi:fucolectin-7, partial [Biomphalaria pfeifferi]